MCACLCLYVVWVTVHMGELTFKDGNFMDGIGWPKSDLLWAKMNYYWA